MVDGVQNHETQKQPQPQTLGEDGQALCSYTIEGGLNSSKSSYGSQPGLEKLTASAKKQLTDLTITGTEKLYAVADDQRKTRRRRPDDHIPNSNNDGNGTDKGAESQQFKSKERHNGTIIAVQRDLSEVDKKRNILFGPGDLTMRNYHMRVYNDGKTEANPNNPLQEADGYQLQLLADPALKEKPEVLHQSLLRIKEKYKAQGIDLPIPDQLDKAFQDTLFQAPPQQPDNSPDEDGERPNPNVKPKPDTVTPVTPVISPKGPAGLTSISKDVLDGHLKDTSGKPLTIEPRSLVNIAIKAIPAGIQDILLNSNSSDTLSAQLDAYRGSNAADFTQLAANVANLSKPLLDPNIADTFDAALLKTYFVDKLTNPSTDKAFVGNLAVAFQKYKANQLVVEDAKALFQPDLLVAMTNLIITDVNASSAFQLDLKNVPIQSADANYIQTVSQPYKTKRDALMLNLVTEAHKFEFSQ